MINHMKIFWFMAFCTKQTVIGAKRLRIMLGKIDRFIRDYDETKYLVL